MKARIWLRTVCLLLTALCLLTSCNGGGGNGEESTTVVSSETEPVKTGNEKLYVEVISYNIAYYDSNDAQMKVGYEGQSASDYTIAKRQARLKSFVAHYRPDVLCLQEVNCLWWGYLITDSDSLLSQTGYKYVGNTSALGKNTDGEGTNIREFYNLVFYDPEVFEEVESGTFWLNSRRTRHSGSGDPDLERICTYAILRDKRTGNQTVYASTHLPTRANETLIEKNKQAATYLMKYLNDVANGLPTVVCGDFNMTKTTNGGKNYAVIVEEYGYKNAAESASRREQKGTTRHWGQTPNWATVEPIDHCFYNGLRAYQQKVLADTFDKDHVINTAGTTGGDYYDLSDHLGLYVKFFAP